MSEIETLDAELQDIKAQINELRARAGEVRKRRDALLRKQRPVGILVQSKHYVRELRLWNKAGRPVRDEQRQKEIRDICKQCEHFDNHVCKLCGCPVVRPRWWGDKIAWATSGCPDDPPKWEPEHNG